jgi:hypothetical protein
MNVVELTFEEFWSQYEKLYFWTYMAKSQHTAETKPLLDMAKNLYYKVNNLKSVQQYQVEYWHVVNPVVKYAQISLLKNPYYLLRVICEIWDSRAGHDRSAIESIINCSMSASFLVELNNRLKEKKIDLEFHFEGWHYK